MAGWDACTLEPNAMLRWIECHPAFLTATQDVLLVVTIAVAIAIPLWTAHNERVRRAKERRGASEAFAAALLAPASQALLDMSRVRCMIEALERQGVGWPGTPDALRAIKINVPPRLDQAMQEMHRYDNEVVGQIRTCITGATGFNAFVDQLVLAAIDDVNRIDTAKQTMIATLRAMLETVKAQFQQATGLPMKELTG